MTDIDYEMLLVINDKVQELLTDIDKYTSKRNNHTNKAIYNHKWLPRNYRIKRAEKVFNYYHDKVIKLLTEARYLTDLRRKQQIKLNLITRD